MANYNEFRDVISGSMRYEFDDDMKFTMSSRKNEVSIDFRNMDEEMYEEIRDYETEEVSYSEAQKILAGSKEYKVEGEVLSVADYFNGDEVRIDLGSITEDMYEMLKPEDELDEDMYDDQGDEFTEWLNRTGQAGGPSL